MDTSDSPQGTTYTAMSYLLICPIDVVMFIRLSIFLTLWKVSRVSEQSRESIGHADKGSQILK